MSDTWGSLGPDQIVQPPRNPALPPDYAQEAVRKVLAGMANTARGLGGFVSAPVQMAQPNPYPPGSEEAQHYENVSADRAAQWGPEAAQLLAGLGAPAAVRGAAGAAGGKLVQPEGIRAYHSSPHDFERFDMSKVGTGEGAQSYGHGIYAAENPAVSGQGGQYWQQFAQRFTGPEQLATLQLKNAGFDRSAAAQKLAGDIAATKAEIELGQFSNGQKMTPSYITDQVNYISKQRQALKLLESGKPVGPRTYEVNIAARPEQFLDWDKPLAESPLRSTLEDIGVRSHIPSTRPGEPSFIPATGRDAYQSLVKDIGYGNIAYPSGYGNNPAGGASHMLREAGIPGIRYLDQGSRMPPSKLEQLRADYIKTAPPKTSNYVVFNDKLLSILKKYGLAGAAAIPAANSFGSLAPDRGQL